jgi:hypothetical protein
MVDRNRNILLVCIDLKCGIVHIRMEPVWPTCTEEEKKKLNNKRVNNHIADNFDSLYHNIETVGIGAKSRTVIKSLYIIFYIVDLTYRWGTWNGAIATFLLLTFTFWTLNTEKVHEMP